MHSTTSLGTSHVCMQVLLQVGQANHIRPEDKQQLSECMLAVQGAGMHVQHGVIVCFPADRRDLIFTRLSMRHGFGTEPCSFAEDSLDEAYDLGQLADDVMLFRRLADNCSGAQHGSRPPSVMHTTVSWIARRCSDILGLITRNLYHGF